MRICTNVVKNKLNMYYARVYVPGDLKKLVGKGEIRRSLKTTCYATAVERARPVVIAVRSWFDELRENHSMSRRDAPFYTKITRIGSIETEHADGTKQKVRDIEVDGENEVEVVRNLVPDSGSVVNARTDNHEVAEILKSRQQSVTSSSLDNSGAKLISDAVEDFIDSRVAKKPTYNEKTKNNHRYVLSVFTDLYGDLPVDHYSYDDAVDFRNVLQILPNNYRNTKPWKALPINQILKHDDLDESDKLSPKRISDMLKSINAVFTHAVDVGIGGTAQVSIFKTIDVAYDCENFQPFTTSELVDIFDNLPRDKTMPCHYWVPLIALYSGMRRSEIFFRTVDDIKRDKDGVWYIDINRIPGVKETKNKSAIRCIPIHSTLIEKGFLDFVESVKKTRGADARLFVGYTDHGTQAGYKYSDTFAAYLDELGITAKAKSLHSFRSTIINALQEAEVNPVKRNRITGHSNKSIADDVYGGSFSMTSLKKELEKAIFKNATLGAQKWTP